MNHSAPMARRIATFGPQVRKEIRAGSGRTAGRVPAAAVSRTVSVCAMGPPQPFRPAVAPSGPPRNRPGEPRRRCTGVRQGAGSALTQPPAARWTLFDAERRPVRLHLEVRSRASVTSSKSAATLASASSAVATWSVQNSESRISSADQ